MTSERWRQIELVYHAAIECEPQSRAEYLAEACRGDDDLRKEVESLPPRGVVRGFLNNTRLLKWALAIVTLLLAAVSFFHFSPDSKLMSVDVVTEPTFQSGTPRPLFQTEMVDTGIRTRPMSWDVAPDGNRFLITSESFSDTSLVNVALNWRSGKK